MKVSLIPSGEIHLRNASERHNYSETCHYLNICRYGTHTIFFFFRNNFVIFSISPHPFCCESRTTLSFAHPHPFQAYLQAVCLEQKENFQGCQSSVVPHITAAGFNEPERNKMHESPAGWLLQWWASISFFISYLLLSSPSLTPPVVGPHPSFLDSCNSLRMISLSPCQRLC